jgi:eukaryotic-like serine/threonine-protein kinase
VSTDPGESSPLTIAVHVDRLCDRFETAWAGSERPRIEAYLEAPDGPNASLAFRELLALELALRRAAGEHPTGDEYRTRFPNFVVELAAAFTEPDRTDEEARGGDSSWSTDLANEPTSPTALSSPKPANWPTLDGYEILSELGRGGMGVVYKALDTRLKRPVALKTILARELATPESLARFQAEAETVARLQHPNVVQVYAVGEQRGIPYFAMEFVAGGSLARKLDGTPWPPVDAARLMEVLARAVDQVHRLGIIHRDLKPANVLLAADGTPKVGDFGLAKNLSGDSGLTGTDAILGSPSYMSPEQAEGKPSLIGPAADVYGLGAIFYELLAGRPPFKASSVLATLDQVKHAEPVALSRLVPGLPRDAETIALKCLRKDASARYATPEDLAEDLRRFVSGEPIRARPVSHARRAGMWCRRKPALAALAAALALSLLGGVAGIAWKWREADAQRASAVASAEETSAINAFLIDRLLAQASPYLNPRRQEVSVLHLLDRASATVGTEFAGRPSVEAELRSTIGRTYHRLGALDKADTHLRQALAIRRRLRGANDRETLKAIGDLGALLHDQGKLAEAEPLVVESLRGLRRVAAADDPDTLKAIGDLALVSQSRGKVPEAEALYREVLLVGGRKRGPEDPAILGTAVHLAGLLHDRGEIVEAETLLERILKPCARVLGPDHPDTLTAQNRFAQVLQARGKLAEAEPIFRANLAATRRVFGDAHRETWQALNNLGVLLQALGRLDEAELLSRSNLDARRKAFGDDHFDTLNAVHNLAALLQERGQLGEAARLYRQNLEACRRVFGPDHIGTLTTTQNLGTILLQQHAAVEAEALLRPAIETCRRVFGPSKSLTLSAMMSLSDALYYQERFPEVEELLREILKAQRGDKSTGRLAIADTLSRLGLLVNARGRPAEAEPLLRESMTIRRDALPKGHHQRAEVESFLGRCLVKLGRRGEAEPLLINSLASFPVNSEIGRRRLPRIYEELGNLYEAEGRPDEAKRWRIKKMDFEFPDDPFVKSRASPSR